MTENPPIMVLVEETQEYVKFQFKGKNWAAATILPGVALLIIAIGLLASGNPEKVLLVVVGVFGAVLIYSSVYSLTSEQWLTADSLTRKIHFYKKNLYGLVDWEKSAEEFKAIQVWRNLRSTNWAITIMGKDDYRLQIGENIFGALSYERAMALAGKVSSRTDIRIESNQVVN